MASPVFRRLRLQSTRPRKALVEPALRLADFYEEVGRAAFDSEWVTSTRPARPSTKRAVLTPLAERAAIVADDLALALQSGIVQAALLLDLPEPKAVQAAPPLDFNSDTSMLTIAELRDSDNLLGDLSADDQVVTAADEPSGRHHHTYYLIEAHFWDGTWRESIDWGQSQLYVPAQFIRAAPAPRRTSAKTPSYPLVTYRPDLRYRPNQLLHGPVVVLHADRALGAMFQLGDLPPPDANVRYLSFKNRLIDEVVAAAWRWLAINRPREQAVKTSELVTAMTLYLERQGIDGEANKLGDKGLEAVARQVLGERESGNFSNTVLKNTRTAKPFKAAPNS